MPSPIFHRPRPEIQECPRCGTFGPSLTSHACVVEQAAAGITRHLRRELAGCLKAYPVAGQSDIARALGLSRQRIGQYRKLSDFPSPVQNVNGAPVWILGDVLEWHEARVTKREAK